MNPEQYYQEIMEFSPNPLQLAVWKVYYQAQGHPAFLVKAGTGTGKTEAVLFPALADESTLRRIVMVLPSKALIEDMAERVKEIGKKLSHHRLRQLALTVDMGSYCRRFSCRDGKVVENTYHRHLFADDVILTTLDKFLFRLFGYGEKTKSFIFPHRIFGTSLGRHPFIVFDEAHEYEGLAFANFLKLLEALYTKGKDLCVMSATLPTQFVQFLETVDATAGELGQRQSDFQTRLSGFISFNKRLQLITPDKTAAAAGENSLTATIAREVRSRYRPDLRIIARTEDVSDIRQLYESLQDLHPMVYHGRLTMQQRHRVIQEIIQRQKQGKGFLLLATSAIESGCDLDSHLIVTELCNPDSMVQLAGRLNRRGQWDNAELLVVGDKIKTEVGSLNAEQLQNYLATLRSMAGRFDPVRLQKYFPQPQPDWMGEILFSMLWDYVYEGDLTSKPLWEKGIMVTRSWEPSVTLCTGLDRYQRPQNAIEIGISRLAETIPKKDKKDKWLKEEKVSKWLSCNDDGTWHAKIYRAYYHAQRGEEGHWILHPLSEKSWVNSYETTLICEIHEKFVSEYFDETLGYIKIPKIFRRGYREGFRRYLDYQPKVKEGWFVVKGDWLQHSGRVWYLDRKGD